MQLPCPTGQTQPRGWWSSYCRKQVGRGYFLCSTSPSHASERESGGIVPHSASLSFSRRSWRRSSGSCCYSGKGCTIWWAASGTRKFWAHPDGTSSLTFREHKSCHWNMSCIRQWCLTVYFKANLLWVFFFWGVGANSCSQILVCGEEW